MHWIDWTIVFGFLVLIISLAIYASRYNRSVADFLAANRCGGRYLLTVAGDASGIGAITILAFYELYYNSGFAAAWWKMMFLPVGVVVALSGFVSYRFRQTRAMTMAQFFEMRYSRNFRIFAGILAFVSGALNYGIFPAVTARFFIYFCGWPASINILGLSVATFPLVMIVLLSTAVFFIFLGGQITIMITDFIQGFFCYIVFVIIIIYLLLVFNWSQVSEALSRAPADASLINPFHTGQVKDFNFSYFAIALVGTLYCNMAWQGSQGYNCAAISPHEARMAGILSRLRTIASMLMFIFVPVCMYTVMHHADFASSAEHINSIVNKIDNPYLQKQMLVPVALKTILPTGLLGAMLAMMLGACLSTDDAYLHSWGSIFIQDVIVPFRKKPLSPKLHIRLLRCSIFSVAVFAFIFSLVFPQKQYILMWFAITGAIYIGGAGSAIIGGLYWKRGTTAAALTAMIAGTILSVAGIVIRQINPAFALNGQHLFGIAILSCIFLYVAISLLSKKPPFNLDKMLHRGKYSLESDLVAETKNKSARSLIMKRLGITEEFNNKDKFIYFTCLIWISLWFGVFLLGTIYNLIYDVSDQTWLKFWYTYITITLLSVVVFTIWFGTGGILDIRNLFTRLKAVKRDHLDDGTVFNKEEFDKKTLIQEQNLDMSKSNSDSADEGLVKQCERTK